MGTPFRSNEECRAAVDLVKLHGSISAASKQSGTPRQTIQAQIRDARGRWPGCLPDAKSGSGWAKTTEKPQPAGEKPRIRVKAVCQPEPPPADPIDLRRARDQAAFLKRRVADLETQLIEREDAYKQVVQISRAQVDTVEWMPAPAVLRGSTLLPLLFASDFQCGEVIKPAELDGMNAYDKDIFAERYQLMIEKTINLAEHHTGASSFAGAIYARGGDAISGGIHAELAETDDLSSVPAVRWVMQQEREGIRRLRDKFGRVHVISIPGNHGRNTFKSHSKGYVEHSYETLLAWWLQTQFDEDSRVTFDTPKSGDAYFDALGWKFLMAHGDRMGSRGGAGYVGPAATIARGHKKLYDAWTTTGMVVDRILTGHLHTSLKLERGYANGAMSGYNEYARDLQCFPDAAKQWLLFVSEKICVSHAFELQLSDPPKRSVSTKWAA
jgi:hypothetical protein